MPKLHDLGAAEAAKAIRTGETTAEALAELQTKAAADVARVLRGEKPVYPVKG